VPSEFSGGTFYFNLFTNSISLIVIVNSFKLIVRLIQKAIFWFLTISLVWVLIYRFINPPITLLMLQRAVERKIDGKDLKIDKSWLPIEDISTNLKRASIAGEDANFLNHMGFDFKAIETAFEKNKKGKRIRGGSTISQQTAKNVFLWPGRSYIRKAFEAYFTVLIELLWGKERILEVYLNVIEMGDGIYGSEAAVQNYWGKSANSMSKSQAALLVAVLPNPRRWNPARPSRFVYYKQSLILRNMSSLKKLPF
jgi:monofunctional biosynthetic peptidoglycan transglycosylase